MGIERHKIYTDMNKLLFVFFILISANVSAQYATYQRIDPPVVNQQQSNVSVPKVQQKKKEKEEVFRTTGYYLDASQRTARVALQFTVKQSHIGEVITIVGYKTSNAINWMKVNTTVSKTGYYDPEDFDYKVGLLNLGTVYFNY